MSRKPSKFRKRKREQREKRASITVDIETRGHFHISDPHIGIGNHKRGRGLDQLMAYARLAGVNDVVVLTGGDVITERPPRNNVEENH